MSKRPERGFPRPVKMNIQSLLMYEDGYRDPRKVIVRPLDEDRDGVPDDPTILEEVVQNFDQPAQRVYFRKFTDFDGYEYFGLWSGEFLEMPDRVSAGNTGGALVDFFRAQGQGNDMLWIAEGQTISLPAERAVDRLDMVILERDTDDIDSFVTAIENRIDQERNRYVDEDFDFNEDAVSQFDGLIVNRRGPEEAKFYILRVTENNGSWDITREETTNYAERVGRSFTLNSLLPVENPLHFLWKHYAPRENRIDPSISNIIDMFVITNDYFRRVQQWKDSNNDVSRFPEPPTGESLRVQFGELNQFKMLSDEIVFKPGRFKLPFGRGAEPELTARFKVVKLPSATLTDNEVKSRVIDAIDRYFALENWDFGERFYYTELSAYIHQSLSNIISTVVIVPEKAESAFGNLFQIKSEVNELFLSTATVADVDVVRNLTETNLRVRRGELFRPE